MKSKTDLLTALKSLRLIAKLNAISLDDSVLQDESLMQEYFEAPLYSDVDKKFEKLLTTAIIRSTYENNKIPEKFKKIVADKKAREAVDCVRYVKLLEIKSRPQNQLSANEIEQKLKENIIAKRAAIVRYVGRRLIFAGVKLTTSVIISVIVGSLGISVTLPSIVITLIAFGVITIIESIVPKNVKERIHTLTRNMAISAIGKAENAIKKIKEKVQNLTEKVEPVIIKIKDRINSVGHSVQESWKKVTERIKNKIFK